MASQYPSFVVLKYGLLTKIVFPIYIVCQINFSKPWSVCMLMVQLNFNLCYITNKRGNCHSNSLLKELRKLMDLPQAGGENMCVINILQNSLFIFFLISASHIVLVSFFPLFSFIYSFLFDLTSKVSICYSET